MTRLLPLPILLPLLGAAASILVGRSVLAQRVIGVSVLVVNTAVTLSLLIAVDRDGTLVTQGGGWPAPIGITLVADRLSAIMLVVAAVMLLTVLIYAIGEPGAERNHVGFQSVYLVLAAGVSASFLTGDLFNLFVSFEVMLTASYVLLTLGGGQQQVRAGMTYVVISLVASVLLVTAVALLYSATGTVNLADLAERLGELPEGLRTAFAVLLLVVFGIKAALFPLFFWLPDSYPIAPSPITAIFAGLLTKVGIYAIIRTQTLLFPPDSRPATVILWMAGATMLVGVLGALAQTEVKRILSFNLVSHIGYMALGLGLFTVVGLAGAVFYIVHHIVSKTALFLAGGMVEHTGGSSRLKDLGGLVRVTPVTAALFLLPALGLVGIPPLSGFVPKLALIDGGLTDEHYVIVGVAVLASFLSLLSMLKIWSAAFWGTPPPPGGDHSHGEASPPRSASDHRRIPALMTAPTAALVALALLMAAAAGPLYSLSERTAEDLLTPSRYVDHVLDR